MYKFVAAAMTGAHTANAVYRIPGDYECLLYEHPGFNGREMSMYVYPERCFATYDMRWYDFNDKMSSWSCGKNVKADFCDEPVGKDC
jgi:hypothetical protein